jgi:heme-degrading monooxygenase HmoA
VFCYLWEYRVAPGKREQFRQVYGKQGPWVKLFEQCSGYVRTDLFEDRDTPGRFISMDCWEQKQDWEAMKSGNSGAYQQIDQACESLSEDERLVGYFEAC